MDIKIARLEEKVAFLEQALQELGDEHFAQKRELDQLSRQLENLINKYKNQSFESTNSSENYVIEDEKPPHY